jgi:DNA repair protein RadC
MPITDWPKAERPREKLLALGANALSDAELLAIFLRTGIKGKTAVDLARDIISHFGGLRQLLLADQKAFCQFSGLGEAKFSQLQAVIELSRRHLKETLQRGQFLQNPQTTRDYLSAQLRDLPYEVFACLFLDNQHRVIEFEILFQGTINGASVHPREVVRKTLKYNAAALILAHNHPSGIAEPSSADRHITKQLTEALALIDVRILDHIVVGDGECVAFSERGWI